MSALSHSAVVRQRTPSPLVPTAPPPPYPGPAAGEDELSQGQLLGMKHTGMQWLVGALFLVIQVKSIKGSSPSWNPSRGEQDLAWPLGPATSAWLKHWPGSSGKGQDSRKVTGASPLPFHQGGSCQVMDEGLCLAVRAHQQQTKECCNYVSWGKWAYSRSG